MMMFMAQSCSSFAALSFSGKERVGKEDERETYHVIRDHMPSFLQFHLSPMEGF